MRIAENDFSRPLQPSDERDDVDAVIVGINVMAEQLSMSYRLLDQRVAQRTRELREATDALRVMTLTDHLTGVGNRNAMEQQLEARLAEHRRGEAPPVVISLDVDHFKEINDHLGHDAGDLALRRIAALLTGNIRDHDGVFRLGGDEFAILLGGAMRIADAESLSLRLIRSMEERPVVESAYAARLGLSCGIAVARLDSTGESLMFEADTAMYVSKRSRTNKVNVFEDAMSWARQRNVILADQLREGLLTDHVVVPHFQPIVNLASGCIVAAEALLRWDHPVYGIISPAEVLPLARQANLMNLLTESMVSQVLGTIGAWRVEGLIGEGFRVSVNVEVEELKSLAFVEFVARELRHHAVPGDVLTLEITENLELQGEAAEHYAVESLRRMGVRLSIDDFGTGYSALAYLRSLPAQSAKVDRSLVAGIDTDPRKRDIAAAVLQLIEVSGLSSVAEGIESAALAEEARNVGFDMGQGYHFGRPMPVNEFAEILRNR